MAPLLKVAVIGAGISGLTTAHALKGEGHQVVVYEKSDQLGGTWAYNPQVESDPLGLDPNRDIVHSSLYHSLCTNLPRQLMGLLDYPFASRKYDDSRTFPHHKEVLEFLNEFAGDFGLLELIRFNTEVVRVEQVDLRSDQWIVGSKTNKLTSDEIFDAVVVCIGHHTQPRLADIPASMQIDHVDGNGEVTFGEGVSSDRLRGRRDLRMSALPDENGGQLEKNIRMVNDRPVIFIEKIIRATVFFFGASPR
ncbi:hypothetical protein DH2020_023302 [Rehmannia glutinosa]|uniref:Flavin-containing monooxygenase n=1 Tax=Rehmannia glutinosa TaxID=99300 RepID=A0ABR0WA47_REHGL